MAQCKSRKEGRNRAEYRDHEFDTRVKKKKKNERNGGGTLQKKRKWVRFLPDEGMVGCETIKNGALQRLCCVVRRESGGRQECSTDEWGQGAVWWEDFQEDEGETPIMRRTDSDSKLSRRSQQAMGRIGK